MSTAALIVGVAAAGQSQAAILVVGTAGLVAGAMSMAAGEFVSVSSQADTERADLEIERREIAADHEYERQELAAIYVNRGLSEDLAGEVATQLMAHDALGAHARDELGLSDTLQARPLQAAGASALAFTAGAALPLLTVLLAPAAQLLGTVALTSLLFLAGLGALAARAGGASPWRGALRVTFWGTAAMAVTAAVGQLIG